MEVTVDRLSELGARHFFALSLLGFALPFGLGV